MPQTGPDSSDGPDFFEALRGMAHLSDFARKMMGSGDPQMRKQVEMLGQANVKDVVEAVGDQLDSDTPTPHMDIRDTDGGLEVLVDASETPVNPSNITTIYEDDNLTLMEPQVGWEAEVTTEGTVEAVDVEPSGSGLATVTVALEGAEGDPDRDTVEANDSPTVRNGGETEAEQTDPTSAMTQDTTPTDESDGQSANNIAKIISNLDEDVTLNEALEENPELADLADEKLSPEIVSMARMMHGDTPLKDIPFEDLAPDGMNLPDDLPTADEGNDSMTFDSEADSGFSFGDDPLEGADDE